ncbi:hypothetical protein DL96DRAFT_905526 [Flagelloscypha sp. PMI_526]|nr:hypothetical protein DL96DRAFT_905526 [Flagelloscypha sp. PMI_526]
MVQLIRNTHLVPNTLRYLIYTSLILAIPTLAFSIANFAIDVSWVPRTSVTATLIYHIVLICHHNRISTHFNICSPGDLIWLVKWNLIWAYIVALWWTASVATSIYGTVHRYGGGHGIGSGTREVGFFVVGILEIVFVVLEAGVFWGIVGFLTRLRRKEKVGREKLPG